MGSVVPGMGQFGVVLLWGWGFILEVQCSQTCDGFFRNTRIILYTPATVSLSLLKRFINSSVLSSLYYLTFFIHICRIPLPPTLPLVFHETNSL